MDNTTEEIASRYPAEEILSASGYCQVFSSRHPNTAEQVVVKLLQGIQVDRAREGRQRFLSIMSAIDFGGSRAFPRLFDYGFSGDGSAYLVMEKVEGIPLERYRGEPVARLVPLLTQVIDALEALATNEVSHHNLTPDNIFVVQTEAAEEVRILGVGTAAYLGLEGHGSMLAHSPDAHLYAPPELLDTAPTAPLVGWRADLYSTGLLSCELLGLQVEKLGTARPVVVVPDAVSSELRDAQRLKAVLERVLRPDPEERQADFADLREAMGLKTDVAFSSFYDTRTIEPEDIVPEAGDGAQDAGAHGGSGLETEAAFIPPEGYLGDEELLEPELVDDLPEAEAVVRQPSRGRWVWRAIAVVILVAVIGLVFYWLRR
jgi:serine/threonine protein kinase